MKFVVFSLFERPPQYDGLARDREVVDSKIDLYELQPDDYVGIAMYLMMDRIQFHMSGCELLQKKKM